MQLSVIPFYTLSYKVKQSYNSLNRASPLIASVASRENKNRFVFAFLKSLIDCGMFEHIYLNFLPVGHTHCDIDQLFSRIAIWMRGTAHFYFQCVALALALMNCCYIYFFDWKHTRIHLGWAGGGDQKSLYWYNSRICPSKVYQLECIYWTILEWCFQNWRYNFLFITTLQ